MADPIPWAELINKVATPVIAGVSAFYVYLQYRRSLWLNKKERAADVLAALENDDVLAFACRALDWGVGPLIVPERYRPLLCYRDQKIGPIDANPIIQHDTWAMYLALRPRLNPATLNEPRGLIYRYCFDKFLTHIDGAHRLLMQGQLLLEDLEGFKYWISRLSEYQYRPQDRLGRPVRRQDVFQPFIAEFDYIGVRLLGKKLGIKDWVTVDDYRAKRWTEAAALTDEDTSTILTLAERGSD